MCILNQLIEEVTAALTGSRNADHNIVRVHTRKLQEFGDLSFPLDTKSWFKFLDKTHVENRRSIFECLLSKDEFQERSKEWVLSVENILVNAENVVVRLDRQKTFTVVINAVLKDTVRYGAENVGLNKKVYIPENKVDFTKINLTDLKVYILQKIVINILQFANYNIIKNCENNENVFTIKFSPNVAVQKNTCVITCGPILNEHGTKDVTTTAEQLYNKRMVDMRLMAEHKYGVRTTSLPGWKEFFQKLGEAAVTIHLLQNKPQHTTVIKLNDPASSSIKGASFILYNCARLATLLKEFDKKVAAQTYPPLPELQKMDFSLLVEPEEWELLFVYILRFPMVIKNCISQIEKNQVSPHFLVLHLSGLASTFSVYYRRVRILTEPREHLFSVLHQRIYLLKSLQIVFHNSLRLLNIEPVKQM